MGPKGRNNSYNDLLLFIWLGKFFIWRIPACASGSGKESLAVRQVILRCNFIPVLVVVIPLNRV